ncbi:hypothetical protein ACWEO2_28420 [Nocardia sp. NPDC004278]
MPARLRETGANPGKVDGDAIALGHPSAQPTTLVKELERVNGHYSLPIICKGGGTAGRHHH